MQRSEMRNTYLKKANLISALCFLLSAMPLYADYSPIDVPGGGTIRGLVKFPTESPPRAMFGTRGDASCPAGVPMDNLYVKQENRGIKNALVVLEIEEGKASVGGRFRLESRGCRFFPRMQWIPAGMTLQLVNSDPSTHNFHATRMEGLAGFNLDIPPRQSNRRPLAQPGLYKVNDEKHLWMRSWIYVSEHPYVAVTDIEGRFELTHVPPGTYTLRAWHEGWKEKGTDPTGQPMFQPVEQSLRVKVKSNSVTDVQFDGLGPTFQTDN
jgi:hypothetical protein